MVSRIAPTTPTAFAPTTPTAAFAPTVPIAAFAPRSPTVRCFGFAAGASSSSAFGGASSSISFSDIAANPTTFGVGFGSSDKPIDVEPVVAPIVATPFAPPEHVPPVSTPKIKKEDPESEGPAGIIEAINAAAAPPRRSARIAPRPESRRSDRIKVKQEAMRDQPGRKMKLSHKVGFYSEANQAKLGIRGSGSIKDPYVVY